MIVGADVAVTTGMGVDEGAGGFVAEGIAVAAGDAAAGEEEGAIAVDTLQ
jgi:hypothetical protein